MSHLTKEFRLTRGKKLRTDVREVYTRNDIPCGSSACSLCQQFTKSTAVNLRSDPYENRYIILDTDVVLTQMDVLEQDCDPLCDVIILQTVSDGIQQKDLGVFKRLLSLKKDGNRRFVHFDNEHHQQTFSGPLPGESAKDRTSRMVRNGYKWYAKHLSDMEFLLIVNDDDAKELAKVDDINVVTIAEFVESLKTDYPQLIDLLSGASQIQEVEFDEEGRKLFYPKHLLMSELNAGIKAKTLYRGTYRHKSRGMHRGENAWGTVTIRGFALDRDDQSTADTMVTCEIQSDVHINRAFDGDVVAVEILPKSQWKQNPSGKDSPRARVAGIIKRNWRNREYCCSILIRDDAGEEETLALTTGRVLAEPWNGVIPRIRIRCQNFEEMKDKRFLVSVDEWPAYRREPSGHLVRIIGTIGDKETETEVLLLEHDIPTRAFSPAVMACLPPNDWTIPDIEKKRRNDLRPLKMDDGSLKDDYWICSIDPPGCKDIDDALHSRSFVGDDGKEYYEYGVHIADVTYFNRQGSAMDMEAMDRANTTYLVNKRLDMLPSLLTENLCSLRPKEDRLAFSVTWVVDPETYNIVSVNYFRSIIYSREAFTYEQAQTRMDDSSMNDDLTLSVRRLNAFARVLRQRRIDAGALTLASPEVKFQLDSESQNPLDVKMYEHFETNHLVEEFMLLANIWVARKITAGFPRCSVLRRHPVPPKQNFDFLVSAAASQGFEIKTDTSKDVADALDLCISSNNPHLNKMVRILATRCMLQAAYFCSGTLLPEEYSHYGLATPIYTHFTSPIRRYCDVVAHRLLSACLRISPLPKDYEDKEAMTAMCDNMNRRHYASQMAGRGSAQLHTHIFFKNRKVNRELACVLRVKEQDIDVLVLRYGIEQNIRLIDSEKEPLCDFDEANLTLTHKTNGKQLRVFDQVYVCIEVREGKARRSRLCVDLVEPYPTGEMAKRAEEITKNTIKDDVKVEDQEEDMEITKTVSKKSKQSKVKQEKKSKKKNKKNMTDVEPSKKRRKTNK